MVRAITSQSPKDKRKSSTPHKRSKPSSEVIYSSPKRPGARASTSTQSDAHTKKKRRYRPGTRALMEIRHYQKNNSSFTEKSSIYESG